jgi:hypothetical protein
MVRAPKVRTSAIGLLCLALVGPALAQDGFSAAEAAARASGETAEGKAFAESVGQAFGREHGPTIQRCAKETKRPDLAAFELLLRVAATGLVEEVLAKPETNLARCVRGKLVGWKAPSPPRPGVWVNVAVNLKRG